jgi:putative heme-binding domain-containing protein
MNPTREETRLRLATVWLFFALISCVGSLKLSAAEEVPDRTAMAVEALSRLQGIDVNQNPKIKETVLRVLEKTRGTANFVKLVRQFKLTDQDAGLLEVAVQNSASETGVEAMRLILANTNYSILQSTLEGTNVVVAIKAAEAIGNTSQNESTKVLLPLVTTTKSDLPLRKQAVRSLAQTPEGAAGLIRLAKDQKLSEDLKLTASSELSRVRWPAIKAEAATLLPLPQGRNAEPLPPLAELLKLSGDPANGAKIFSSATVGCANCHQVKGQGVDFGPNLTEIGSKLGKDALYEAILDPSAGISFGFEAWQLQLKSGDEAYGLLVSETADELALKAVGGIVTRYKKSEISQRDQMKLSIMPVGLQQAMTTQELVDLVEYLFSLKKAVGN